ncbi:MAG: histidine phosphatase family protein [Faecalibacterium prausnitzii]
MFATPPKGESYDAFYQRVSRISQRLFELPYHTVLICSHNQFLKMLYFNINQLPVTSSGWNSLDYASGVITKIY